jgi:CheY-like chemotaxis protein
MKQIPSETSSKTILIAEDDTFVRKLTAKWLGQQGYKVLEAGDGKDALNIVCDYEGDIDLLFTDVVMPEMNGHQLADIAQALRPGLRVLFTSAYTDRMIVAQAIRERGMAFVEKTFNSKELQQHIRVALAA